MDVKKSQRVPPFTFFGTVILFKNLILKYHFKKSPKGSPSIFLHILQPAGVSQSPKGPPFTISSLRYSADFGRSRLVFFFNHIGCNQNEATWLHVANYFDRIESTLTVARRNCNSFSLPTIGLLKSYENWETSKVQEKSFFSICDFFQAIVNENKNNFFKPKYNYKKFFRKGCDYYNARCLVIRPIP